MISSQHENIILILNLHSHQQDENFHAKGSTINIISQKQYRLFGILVHLNTQTKHLQQVLELPMNITYYRNWLALRKNVGLIFDNIVKSNDNVLDEFEGHYFLLIKTLLQKSYVNLTICCLEMLYVDYLLFLHCFYYLGNDI